MKSTSEESVGTYTLKKPSLQSTSVSSFWDEDMGRSVGQGRGEGLLALRQATSLSAEGLETSLNNLTVRNERPLNTLDFVTSEYFDLGLGFGTLEELPSAEQEKLLTGELLFVLSGTQSCLIQAHPSAGGGGGLTFTVDPRIEHSLRELALEIANLAKYYHSVTKFVEKRCGFEDGKVNGALGAALRDILKDYHLLLSQTETLYMQDELSLQKMLFFVNPTMQVMSILNSIVVEIERGNCRGGQVLSLLHEKSQSMVADATGQSLCFNLAQKASAPYFNILENWIYKGAIVDPFNEFFVHDTGKGEIMNGRSMDRLNDNDNYWENRYALEVEKCPSFLRNVNQEILKAGKYLNVIRQCRKDVNISEDKISYSIHERVYVAVIEKAYMFASKTLLDLLLNEYDLLNRLKSVKHYLLMDQGDFIVQFLDLTEAELRRPIDDLNLVRLKALLELAMRTSSSSMDPYKDCVDVEVFPYSIAEQMLHIIAIETPMEHKKAEEKFFTNFRIPGFEGFAFSYVVQWPVSLVLNSRASTCYQLIFRHLFFCKHVERQLCEVWRGKKKFKSLELERNPEQSAIFYLHQQMLTFVQNLQYYITFEVIEPAWGTFLLTMGKVTNVDDVLECHLTMLNSILDDSMLTSPPLLARMTSLLALCLQFSEKVLGSSELVENSNQFRIVGETIPQLIEQFDKELVEFLREASLMVQNPNHQSSKVANIIYRFNFNGFYTNVLDD